MDRAALASHLLTLAPLVLTVAAVGAMVELTGGGWDINYHLAQRPETFWTPPHVMLYSGATAVFAAGLYVLLLLFLRAPVAGGLRLTLSVFMVGAGLQLVAGGFDQWWHATFGVDDALSPPHVMLTGGMVAAGFGLVLALGVLRREPLPGPLGSRPRAILAAQVVAFGALWYSIWGFFFILTFPGLRPLAARLAEAQALGILDHGGQLNYVFAHPLLATVPQRLAVALIFAAIEPFALVLGRRLVDWSYAATAIAAVGTAATVAIGVLMAATVDPSQAPTPFFLIGLVPGLIVDGAWWATRGRNPTPGALVAGAAAAELSFLEFPRGVLFAVGWPLNDPLTFGAVFAMGGLLAAALALVLHRDLLAAMGVPRAAPARPRNGA